MWEEKGFFLCSSVIVLRTVASWMKLPFTVFAHRASLHLSVHLLSSLSLPVRASYIYCDPDTCQGHSAVKWIIIYSLLLKLDSRLPKVKGCVTVIFIFHNLQVSATC